jgi:poly-gamma-glutamate synthesis protein (capsule biosynthesis protein)
MNEPAGNATVRLMLGGDVMLGRLVAEEIQAQGPLYPLGGVAATMRQADLTIVNLECAITSSAQRWSGARKAFYFGAPPAAVQSLLDAGVDGVTLANNHVLDFDYAGLRDTLQILTQHGIGHAGAGMHIDEARAPLFFERGGIKFGMAAYCDHQADFAAQEHGPGISYLDLDAEADALEQFRLGLMHIQKGNADWPILSLHWGPNMIDRPSPYFVRLAHAAIDMGYRILFGHSAHVFHGVEIYRGCPIVYAAGDLVDDYYVDPWFQNDHQLLFELELSQDGLQRIRLYPIFISDCRVSLASGEQFQYIASRASALCAEMGSRVERADNQLWIEGGQ